MKHTHHTIAAVITLSALLVSCTGNKTDADATDSIAADTLDDSIQTISEYSLQDTVTVQGELYTYDISFHNDPSAPTITNYEGIEYYQNEATLTIYRGKSSEVFHTIRFTKEDLKSYIPAEMYDHCTLVGMNFNYMELGRHDSFHFIAVAGDPDETADITYIVAIDILKNKSVSMHQVTDIDTAPISDDLNIDPEEDDA